jgi:hypothetical protein
MAYGEYRNSTIKGLAGTTWYVKIYKNGFSGSPTDMDLEGEGFEVKWSGQGGTRDRQFLTSECIVSWYVQNVTDESFLYDIFDNGDKQYFLRIYKGGTTKGNVWWYGWIQPSFDRFENSPYPYVANIIATDSIGVYKERLEDALTSATWNTPSRINNHIADFGTTMSIFSNSVDDQPSPVLTEWYKTSVDWYRDGETYQANDPFYTNYTVAAAYRKDIDKSPLSYKKYDVLKGALKSFNAVGFLSDGQYCFIQPNSYVGTTGTIRTHEYFGTSNEVQAGSDETNLLTIDSSNHILSGGSITYEPVFGSVSCNFKNGKTTIDIPHGVDLTTETSGGYLNADLNDSGLMTINFEATHTEVFNASEVSLTTGFSLVNARFTTIGQLTIKIGTGTGTRYIQEGAGSLVWSEDSTPSQTYIEIFRGYGQSGDGPLLSNSNSDYVLSGFLSNDYLVNQDYAAPGLDSVPCSITLEDSIYTANTQIIFGGGSFPIPEVSGEVTVQLTCVNTYYEYDFDASYPNNTTQDITQPSTVTRSTVVSGPPDSGVWLMGWMTSAIGGDQIGLKYTTDQTDTDAYEHYDLGDVTVGETVLDNVNYTEALYGVQYNTGTDGSPVMNISTSGYRRADTGGYYNLLQLLTREFLALQTKPLEILQADVYSANISPLKLLKYSINDDGTYKYYMFLGGTFKAQSEIMSGEWFAVSQTSTLTQDPPDEIGGNRMASTNDVALQKTITNNSKLLAEEKLNGGYGKTDTIIPKNVAATQISLDAALKGKIYDNQKIYLCYPDGANGITLTANGASTTSDTDVDVDSFTPEVDYPIGCYLLTLPYELSNVITGLPDGLTKEVQFNDGGSFKGDSSFEYDKLAKILSADNIDGKHFGTNLGVIYNLEMYLSPLDFKMSSGYRNPPYTDDDGATIRPSSASVNYYASFQVPIGYEATRIDLKSSSNDAFEVFRCSYSTSGTTSVGLGTTNTELTLSSVVLGAAGTYAVIEWNPSATTDELYGCKITLART